MSSGIVTNTRIARGLLADSMSLFIGLPPTAPVNVSAVEAKRSRSSLTTVVKTQLAFIVCFCTGCFQ